MDATEQNNNEYIERLFPRCSPPKPRHPRRKKSSISHRMAHRRLKMIQVQQQNNSTDSSDSETGKFSTSRSLLLTKHSQPASNNINQPPNSTNNHIANNSNNNQPITTNNNNSITTTTITSNTNTNQTSVITSNNTNNVASGINHSSSNSSNSSNNSNNNNDNIDSISINPNVDINLNTSNNNANTNSSSNNIIDTNHITTTTNAVTTITSNANTTSNIIISNNNNDELNNTSIIINDSNETNSNNNEPFTSSSNAITNEIIINTNISTTNDTTTTTNNNNNNNNNNNINNDTDTSDNEDKTEPNLSRENNKYLHIFLYEDPKNEPIKVAVNRHDDSNDSPTATKELYDARNESPPQAVPFMEQPAKELEYSTNSNGTASFLESPSATTKELYDTNLIISSPLLESPSSSSQQQQQQPPPPPPPTAKELYDANSVVSIDASAPTNSRKTPLPVYHVQCLESVPEEENEIPSTTNNLNSSSQHPLDMTNYHASSGTELLINSNSSTIDNTNTHNNTNNNNSNITSISTSNNNEHPSNPISIRPTHSSVGTTLMNNVLSHGVQQEHHLNHTIGDDDDDDDLHEKVIPSALMFPRLNEGLSSGAESDEDEPYEDDECADDADNDDDGDDENDVDDTDLYPSSLHNLKIRQYISMSTAKLQHQQGTSRKKKSMHISSTMGKLNISDNNNNTNTDNNDSILDRPISPLLRNSNRIFNCSVPNDLSGLMKSDSSYMLTSSSVHRSDLQGGEHPNASALNKQSDMKQQQQPLSNFDHSLAIQSNNNDHHNSQQLNHWSSHQQPSTSQQQDHRENSGYNISKINNHQSDVKTNQFSSDTDIETDRLLGSQRNDQVKLSNNNNLADGQNQLNEKSKANNKTNEVLIEGVLFMVKYLGSTQLECDGQTSKQTRVNQATAAVYEVKNTNPGGEPQPHAEVKLFISTEKIMVLQDNNGIPRVLMDHSLRTISYIADIGEILVLMARRRNLPNELNDSKSRRVAKMTCHVFESDEAQVIAQSMNHAFQLAYVEFLKASGIDEPGFLSKEMDYQEVLNSQEMSTDELEMFANRKNQKEVIVPKQEGEILGISIVESGWGSMLPTVVIADLKPDGPAYRCKKLTIGDQILSINGNSLVGLPLADCQKHIRRTKNQTVARLSIVPCPITVEVKIKRPDTKFQLGFSVQNGVICSLLRGGIAERGGVRVGHRIMSINGHTVVGVPHEKIVNLLASSVGEIRMKTCLTSLYRLMLGQEHPVHF